MSAETFSKKSDIISLSVAVTLVSYSRDYIARLAREGKIVAEQIDREWFISRQSLLNFSEHAALEDSAKKKILSLSRKNDLEVKDFYTEKVSSIYNRRHELGVTSASLTVAIMIGGLFAGYFVLNNAPMFASDSSAGVLDTLALVRVVGLPQSANVIQADSKRNPLWSEGLVIESNESIAMDGGIVLFPTLRAGDDATVEELFSDDVTVVVTSTTTGFVRSADGNSELPFVRVPQGTDTTF
jgi:hypothetical protein